MNTQEIQQIVRDLAQAKDQAQEFADSSVGQFRQVQAALTGLVQVAGDQLGGLSGQFEAAGQNVSENAVPLLQNAVDTLLGDLGKLGNLGDVIPGGEKLGGAVQTLTTALGGLSGFLAENSDLIGKIGLSEEHTQKIAQVASTVLTVRNHLAEVGKTATAAMDSIKSFAGTLGKAGEAVPALSKVLGPASKGLQSIGAIGATAFIGWEIGKVIGEVTGLNRKLSELAENRALKNQKSDWEQFQESWVSAYGGLDKTNRNRETAKEVYDRKFGEGRNEAKSKKAEPEAVEEQKKETPLPESSPPPESNSGTGQSAQGRGKTERPKGKPKPVAANGKETPPSDPFAPPEGNPATRKPESDARTAYGAEQAKAEETAAGQVGEEREEARREQQAQDEAAIGDRETYADQASKVVVAGGKQLAEAEEAASTLVLQAQAKTSQDQTKANGNRVAQLRERGRNLATAAKQATGRAQAAWNALLQPGSRKEARKARKEQEKKERQKQKAEDRLERQVASARRREAELKRAGLTTKEARQRMTTRGRELLKADDLRRKADKAQGTIGKQHRGTEKTRELPSSALQGGVPPTDGLSAPASLPQPPVPPVPLADAGILRELQSHTRLLGRIATAEGVQ